MKAKTIRNWYLVHKWTSLISTLFLLMLCITGLPLIFYHEIDHALGYAIDAPERPGVDSVASLDAIVEAARARRGEEVQYVFQEPEEPEAWYLTMGETSESPDFTSYYMYDARTGDYLYEYPVNQGFMNVMYRLHLDMYAGLSGTLFLGAMGLLLVVSLISGVVVYGPFMSKLKFGTVRHDRSPRLKWLDLHNLLGIATLVWVLVVGATGVINTLSIPIVGFWQYSEMSELTAEFQGEPAADVSFSVEQALATAREQVPDSDLSFIAWPGTPYASPHHFGVFMQGSTPFTSKLLTPVLVEAETGDVTAVAELPWYVSTLLLSQPLHFGDYGGLPLKILWALLDIIAIVVLGSGVYLWLKKRKVPLTERLPGLKGLRDEDEYLPLATRDAGELS